MDPIESRIRKQVEAYYQRKNVRVKKLGFKQIYNIYVAITNKNKIIVVGDRISIINESAVWTTCDDDKWRVKIF